ncbi:GFA family protein [Pelagerythrobacter marinus]|uniref:GFA family protein n=1 Tax=Pelagerythrobacter marinus TaxID=538382 RepID=UPI002036AA21|nr:GFA family protein [Pelagerythrobacter marinus]USA40290.1 GFA family protein [Pelagerythrobacter marinus]WPZ05587.1 GFA family protein [Pelagerythrobacter marinus]
MSYTSTCHCGTIGATIAGDLPAEAMTCNCSICRRKGTVLHFVPADAASLHAPADKLRDYRFGKNAIHHHFCMDCGCTPFATGTDPQGNAMVAVNLRCVEDCDLDRLKLTAVDGASF